MNSPNSPFFKRLQNFDFLRGVDTAALTRLAESATWKVFAPDAVIFWEGDVESNLYYLQYGLLKVMRSAPDGREQTLRFFEAGEIFNEVGALTKRTNPATVIALEESGVWLIPRRALEKVIQAYPQAAIQIIENMADKIIRLIALTADLSLKTIEARYAQLLLEQAKDGVIERRRWTNQIELAAHLGTVPDVLSRIVRELIKAGLIKVDKQQIQILDRGKLEERAQGK